LPEYLAGTPRLNSGQSRHLAAWFHGHEVLVVLIILGIMAAFLILLAIPVLYDVFFNAFSSGMDRAARGTFVLGFGILIVGLASGIRIIDIIGGGVMAAVVVGIIVENYLTPAPQASPSADLVQLGQRGLQVRVPALGDHLPEQGFTGNGELAQARYQGREARLDD
jgi:hypothetical protein